MKTAFDHEKMEVYQAAIREVEIGKVILVGIVLMLVGLIRHTAAHRVYEQHAEYNEKPTETADYDYD